MIQLGITAVVLAPLLTLVVPRRRVVVFAAASSTALYLFLPPQGPPFWLVAGMPVGVMLTCMIALVRDSSGGSPRGIIGLMALMTWTYLADARGVDAATLLYFGTLLGATLTFGLLLGRSPKAATTTAAVLAWNLLPQAAWSLLEQAGVVGSMWPRGTTFDLIATRVNNILPLLSGRSMGSLGHPIILGLVSAIGIACAIYLARKVSKRYWFLAVVGFIPLLLSGTRSAVAALALALLVAMLTSVRKGWATAIAVWVGLGILIALMAGAFDVILNPEVARSASYIHRLSVIESTASLFDRQAGDVLFGSGALNLGDLFKSGLVKGYEGLFFFDNQWVRALAVGGIVGLLLQGVVFTAAIIRSDLLRRLVLVQLLVMTFSFDLMTWPIGVLFLAMGVVYSEARPSHGAWIPSSRSSRAVAVASGEKALS